MDEKLLMKTALLAGKILMENGAEVYRTEDTLERIIRKGVGETRIDEYYTHVTITGIFIRLETIGTDFRRVGDRTYNLTKTTAVNTLSRAYTSGQISLVDMYEALKRVQNEKSPLPNWFKVLCSGILSGSIVLIFDGSFWIGAVVPLVPGITITNSMRDIIAKQFISGTIRFIETFCVAFALGAGIVTVYYIVKLLGGAL